MIRILAAAGILSIFCIVGLVMYGLFSQPPTWYEDLPPKNWEGVDDE